MPIFVGATFFRDSQIIFKIVIIYIDIYFKGGAKVMNQFFSNNIDIEEKSSTKGDIDDLIFADEDWEESNR